MRLFLPIAILVVAALSGYTGLPCPMAQCLSTTNNPAQQNFNEDQPRQPFLTRDPANSFIMEDPNGDRDGDGVVNLLDLHPDDSNQWLQLTPDDGSEKSDSSEMLIPQNLKSSPDDQPQLL